MYATQFRGVAMSTKGKPCENVPVNLRESHDGSSRCVVCGLSVIICADCNEHIHTVDAVGQWSQMGVIGEKTTYHCPPCWKDHWKHEAYGHLFPDGDNDHSR